MFIIIDKIYINNTKLIRLIEEDHNFNNIIFIDYKHQYYRNHIIKIYNYIKNYLDLFH